LATPDAYRVPGGFTEETGEKAMAQLLDLKDPPTAVFASNDSMALGAVRALKMRSLKPGVDVAVAGYDNIRESSLPDYDLTTVDAKVPQLGREVTRLLIQKIQKGGGAWTPQHLVVPVQLVVRSSSGKRRG
jgi:DNA-binding LacI/PurR family transcriptional regulator